VTVRSQFFDTARTDGQMGNKPLCYATINGISVTSSLWENSNVKNSEIVWEFCYSNPTWVVNYTRARCPHYKDFGLDLFTTDLGLL
jgi:hypothetical protein